MRIRPTLAIDRRLVPLALKFAALVSRIGRSAAPSKRLLERTQKQIDALTEKASTSTVILNAARLSLRSISGQIDKRGTRQDAAGVSPKAVKQLLGKEHRDKETRAAVKRYADEAAQSLKSFATAEVERIGKLLGEGARKGWTQKHLASEIRELTSVTTKKATSLARGLSKRLHSRMTAHLAEKAGSTGFVWIHSDNPNPRPDHVARDGRFYPVDDPPPDLPGEFINCGCTADYVFEEEESDEEESEEDE